MCKIIPSTIFCLLLTLAIATPITLFAKSKTTLTPIQKIIPKVPPKPQGFKVTGSFLAGKKVYLKSCAACHGKRGNGKGPLGYVFKPRPTNFTNSNLMALKSDWELFLVVRDGAMKMGLSHVMAPYKEILSEEQIKDVVFYIKHFLRITT